MSDTLYKRCKCRGDDGKDLGASCPRLRRADGSWNPKHGTWYFALELPRGPGGRRRPRMRRGGFGSREAAGDARGDVQLDSPALFCPGHHEPESYAVFGRAHNFGLHGNGLLHAGLVLLGALQRYGDQCSGIPALGGQKIQAGGTDIAHAMRGWRAAIPKIGNQPRRYVALRSALIA